jgi:hypothetical protein
MHTIPTHIIRAFDGSRANARRVNAETDVPRTRFENGRRQRTRRARNTRPLGPGVPTLRSVAEIHTVPSVDVTA